MYFGRQAGWIEVISGVMFSGKSEELIRRVRRAIIARQQVQVFKSHLDARYAGLYSVSSHDGAELEAIPIDTSQEILRHLLADIEMVAVDEVQFLDEGIIDVITDLAGRGIRVAVAGTDTDFRGEPFGAMGHLMAIAEQVTKLQAICVRCGDLACRTCRRPLDRKQLLEQERHDAEELTTQLVDAKFNEYLARYGVELDRNAG